MPWRWPFYSTKASQFASMTVRTPGRAAYPERDAAAIARDAYQRNVIGYRCVWLKAAAESSVPLCLYDGDKEVDAHPLLDLLSRPNPFQDGTFFREAWSSFMMICGDTYLERVDGLGKLPIELYVLRPDRMKVVPGIGGQPVAFDYTVNGTTKRVPVDIEKGEVPILHLNTFNPLSDWHGLSPFDPAGFAIDTHSGAAQLNKSIQDNSAMPSGALMIEADKEGDASLTTEQRDQLKSEIEARFTGRINAGRPLVLEGGMKWQQIGMTFEQMQWIEGKRDAARDIATAQGVPPMLLGIPGDNTYSNYKEANTALWKQTIIPGVWRQAKALSHWLCPAFGVNLRLEPDFDDIDALAEERTQQWDRVNNSRILTVNEKREALGYEPVDGGDVILVSAAEIPLDAAGEDATGGAAPNEGGGA